MVLLPLYLNVLQIATDVGKVKYGKYAGGPSLTQAVLQARCKDQELEEARLHRRPPKQGT